MPHGQGTVVRICDAPRARTCIAPLPALLPDDAAAVAAAMLGRLAEDVSGTAIEVGWVGV